MPTLNWIGKDAVINHDKEVPFRLLKKVKSSSVGNSQNLIIHGDNLEALKAIMPFYIGKVKCVYIDPPYNTGNEGWVYNDKVNSPKIKKWLGKVVGRDSEDLCRHDKWLCMMYPRIKLIHSLLSDDGLAIIHIDENEVTHLKILMDEIFGESNDLGTIVWDKRNPKGDSQKVSYQHESIILFAKNIENIRGSFSVKKANAKEIIKKANNLFSKLGKKDLPEDIKKLAKEYDFPKEFLEKQSKIFTLQDINNEFQVWMKKQDFTGGEKAYRFIDPKGKVYRGVSMAWPNKSKAPDDYWIPLIHPKTKKECPLPSRGWRYPSSTMQQLLEQGYILFGEDHKKQPERKYLLEENMSQNLTSLISFGGSDDSLQKQLGYQFENPKPVTFAADLLDIFTNKNDIILDSFAGSGTTAHAVLKLNKSDEGSRKFVLIEMDDKVAKDITAERVKRAIKQYDYKDGFEYCELSKPLFDEEGQIEDTCDFDQFATYIYFTETQTNIDPAKVSANYIGEYAETEYYLIYKEKGENVLSKSFLKKLKKNDSKKVVYADKCLLDETTLDKYNVVFKQIPYEVKIY
ncbi:MAG: site-specific DNA-methyltransferase [Patescibacteria group bacterium]|jgi:adenine-specific DNA-methyltransferase